MDRRPSDRLRRYSAAKAYQGRYHEEWHAHLNDCPGRLGKVAHACGCFIRSGNLAKELYRTPSHKAGNKDTPRRSSRLRSDVRCAACGWVSNQRTVETISISPDGRTTGHTFRFICGHCGTEEFLY